MCQLLGMNCNTPTDIVFSFEGFSRRGGVTDFHGDGFGIAFFEGDGVRLFHDDIACASSPVADLIQNYPIKSKNVISHIRKATQGRVSLANTHPFMRELWGEYWVFAHNGHLQYFDLFQQGEFFNTVGNTDSERAFCYILESIRQKFITKPNDQELFNEISYLTENIRQYGIFNFMLSNGNWLIAHASTLLYYIVRQAPFGEAKLLDDDVQVDFSAVTTPNDKVAVIATIPLTTNEKWTQLAVNEIVFFKEGEIVYKNLPNQPHYLSQQEGLEIAKQAGAACDHSCS